MPGIVGIIATDVLQQSAKTLPIMVKTMLHETFYQSGTCVNETLGIAAGWVNHEGSFADGMPVWNERKDVCLIVSGEHFDETGAVKAARDLFGLYEEHGAEFFDRLNGPLSGLILDLRRGKVILFNDRFGLNRIYWHENKEGFYFASEAKSLLKVLPELRQLDTQSWGEFFSCGCALENRTLFSGISLLPGGAAWTFRPREALAKASYFKLESWENQEPLSPAAYYKTLKETFSAVLPRYFRGPRQVALSLTGGLDSRMIAAWMPSLPFHLRSFTFGGLYRECADVTIARKVAKCCQQYHEVVSFNRKFFSEFPGWAKRSVYFTDGALDVTGSVEIFMNRMVRETIAPVRLTGNYGDEVLRGYVPFGPRAFSESILANDFLPSVRQATATYAEARRMPRTSFILSKQVPWHHHGRFAAEQTQLTTRSPYLDKDLLKLVYQAPPEWKESIDLALGIINDGHSALSRIPTDRGHSGRARQLLGKVRELGPAITTRAEYAFDYGMPHWLAKVDSRLSRFDLQRLFLGRNKFYHFRTWYRRELAQYVKDTLLDERTLNRPYLNGAKVKEIVSAHVEGRGNYTVEIHKLLSSELIQRYLIEQT